MGLGGIGPPSHRCKRCILAVRLQAQRLRPLAPHTSPRLRRDINITVPPQGGTCMQTSRMQSAMRLPGIEPGSRPWQGRILPLNHNRGCKISRHFPAICDGNGPVLAGQSAARFCLAIDLFWVLNG